MRPLNPRLYEVLVCVFGTVRVTNEGMPRQVSHRPNWHRRGKLRAEQVTAGEQYFVACPFCHDRRGRLSFSHCWGVRDHVTGDDNLHLVHCFNEDCVKTRETQLELKKMLGLDAHARPQEMAVPALGIAGSLPTASPSDRQMLPENLVPIDELARGDAAAAYLTERGFDLRYLRSHWQVSYCDQSSAPPPTFANRIVIPVYSSVGENCQCNSGTLAGWYARAIGAAGCSPKYLGCAGMKKSQLLYGLPIALESQGPLVICEGPTDVWRLQSNAVALFGKIASETQLRKIAMLAGERPVVLFLDADARSEAELLRRRLRALLSSRSSSLVAIADLPAGVKDPGDCTTEQAWEQVKKALRGPYAATGGIGASVVKAHPTGHPAEITRHAEESGNYLEW